MEGDFLGATELQKWLGISKPTLLAWLRREEDPLPGMKVGGRWRFRRQAVLDWWIRQEERGRRGELKRPASHDSVGIVKSGGESSELESWLRIASKVLAEESARRARKSGPQGD